jgi:hypothetical protein
MAPPIKLARTAEGRDTGNTHNHIDTVVIVFDLPFAVGDNPAHETFELSRDSGKKWRKTRAITEPVDDTALLSWSGDVLASGHVAIRFEGLKPGVYKLTRSDGRKEPEVIFANVFRPGATAYEELTGEATDRIDQPHPYWTWLDDFKEAKDPDLKRTLPDVTKLPAPEPKKVG